MPGNATIEKAVSPTIPTSSHTIVGYLGKELGLNAVELI